MPVEVRAPYDGTSSSAPYHNWILTRRTAGSHRHLGGAHRAIAACCANGSRIGTTRCVYQSPATNRYRFASLSRGSSRISHRMLRQTPIWKRSRKPIELVRFSFALFGPASSMGGIRYRPAIRRNRKPQGGQYGIEHLSLPEHVEIRGRSSAIPYK